jgi:DNA-binding NarL/FixJ family response regulator
VRQIAKLDLDDVQVVARLHARYTHGKVVALGHSDDQEHLPLEVLREGARGDLTRERSQPLELVEAIVSPGVTGCILDELSQSH